nr:MAG TPA: hypothetical protein [Caudoviricetes sp.]
MATLSELFQSIHSSESSDASRRNQNGIPREEQRYKFQDFTQTLPKGGVFFDRTLTEAQLLEKHPGITDRNIYVQCVTPSKVPYFATLYSLKLRLYNLTRQFVLKHSHHYYQQYHGDLQDLCQDFFIDFITPKCRPGGRKETLLDKYDSSVTSFEYLVKNAVIRKLIDRSRKDRTVSLSIDNLQEEYGDIITETFQLVDSQKHSELQEFIDPSVDERIFTEDEVEYYRTKFEKLSENVRQSFVREYYKVRNVFASGYRNLFDTIIESVPTTIEVRRGARPEIPVGPVSSEKSFEELAQAMLNVLNALV